MKIKLWVQNSSLQTAYLTSASPRNLLDLTGRCLSATLGGNLFGLGADSARKRLRRYLGGYLLLSSRPRASQGQSRPFWAALLVTASQRDWRSLSSAPLWCTCQ